MRLPAPSPMKSSTSYPNSDLGMVPRPEPALDESDVPIGIPLTPEQIAQRPPWPHITHSSPEQFAKGVPTTAILIYAERRPILKSAADSRISPANTADKARRPVLVEGRAVA